MKTHPSLENCMTFMLLSIAARHSILPFVSSTPHKPCEICKRNK